MAPVVPLLLTAGAVTTELRYLQVQDSACARPMQPPARSAGLRDRIAHATSTKGKTGTSHSAKRSRTDHRTVRMRRCGLTGTYSYQTRHVHGQCTPLPPPWGDKPHSPRYQYHTKTETQRTAHRYVQIAQRTARSQSCGLSTDTYGYQTRHTHGRYVHPPGLPGRRSASATLLLPHTEQTRVPRAGHAAWLCCLPLMSLMASVRLSLPTLTHVYTLV